MESKGELILKRYVGEEIVVGNDDVRIEVLSIDRGKVFLKIKAEKSVPVHRLEVFERIQAEN